MWLEGGEGAMNGAVRKARTHRKGLQEDWEVLAIHGPVLGFVLRETWRRDVAGIQYYA